MSYGISSILRFTGNNAAHQVQQLENDYFQDFQMSDICPASPTSGDWYTFPINRNDVYVCYTNSNGYQDLQLKHVKEKFEELNQGKVYVLGDPNIKHRGLISGTVLC